MAQTTRVLLTCDLDEAEVPAAKTVNFGYDGQKYTFECCETHLAEIDEVFASWIAAARRDGRSRRNGAARRPARSVSPRSQAPARAVAATKAKRARTANAKASSRNASRNASIREWAARNGRPLGTRGRIPADIIAGYEKATSA